MRQIHFLTEAELKRRLDRETFSSLFEESNPSESARKEFFAQVKVWAEEQNAKYRIEFPDSIFEEFELSGSEESSSRSISVLTESPSLGASGVPSKFFPAYVWGESLYFPFASETKTISSKLVSIEEKLKTEFHHKTKRHFETPLFQLEFQILSADKIDLERILDLPIPGSFVERISEKEGEFFLVTPKLNGTQSLFAIYLLSAISEKIEFNFCKLRIDLSRCGDILSVWFARSGSILSGLDEENSPLYKKEKNGNVSSLEISVSPWLSASFLFLILNSSLLDAWENRDGSSPETKTPDSFPKFSKNESWRDLTEHRFASRVSRHANEEESFYHSLLQKEYEVSKDVLESTLKNRIEELDEFEIPELLERLKTVQDSSSVTAWNDSSKEEWKTLQTEISNSVLNLWKERKELTTKKMEENSSSSSWKILIEIWKS
ncbi:hypothetical protein EHQ76_05575 [Leptospira barantonii]|uniref:Uncharacterized protein n=1 Tax=Leptospira barantonii TaxID=2023184 RepID=A0A5F2BND2_9LEPT|nr:hypothetical protein [Leptospira barantonii]TGM07064.1 hypothetical protein EHQ76_05575 [Leptospira barantonii]